ncbi:MAG: helix-turn-helix domain-containing protein [Planctomycetes bacterium]|nr:helix-turn-helix domain-containing protein [Planctomycetota bacterium]
MRRSKRLTAIPQLFHPYCHRRHRSPVTIVRSNDAQPSAKWASPGRHAVRPTPRMAPLQRLHRVAHPLTLRRFYPGRSVNRNVGCEALTRMALAVDDSMSRDDRRRILVTCRDSQANGVAPLEAAHRLGVTRRTIYRYIELGLLRVVHITPRCIRIPLDSLAALQRQGGTGQRWVRKPAPLDNGEAPAGQGDEDPAQLSQPEERAV